MGLSQPALSASLARLRRHFGDELLTRVGQRVPADPAGGAAAGPGPAGADRRRAGVHRPDRSSTRRPRPGSSRCWSATTASRSSGDTIAALLAEEAPHARLRLTAQHAGGGRPRRPDPAEHRPAACCRTASSPTCRTATSTATSGSASSRPTTPAVERRRSPSSTCETLPWVVTFHGPTAATPGRAADADARHRAARPGGHRELPDRARRWSPAASGSRCCSAGWSDLLPLNIGVRALPLPGRGRPAGRGDVVAPGVRRRPRARLPARPRPSAADRAGRRPVRDAGIDLTDTDLRRSDFRSGPGVLTLRRQ